MSETETPRFLRRRPNEATLIPFPTDDATPPVTKINFDIMKPPYTEPCRMHKELNLIMKLFVTVPVVVGAQFTSPCLGILGAPTGLVNRAPTTGAAISDLNSYNCSGLHFNTVSYSEHQRRFASSL